MGKDSVGGGGGAEAAPGPLVTWDAAGVARVAATGADAESAILAGLRAVLAAVRGDRAPASDAQASVAAPVRGQGPDLAALFAELVNDLLAQVDANGPGLDDVRLDGLLRTDDGGYTAWGYVLGAATAAPPPVGVSLGEAPDVVPESGGWTLRFALRRERSSVA